MVAVDSLVCRVFVGGPLSLLERCGETYCIDQCEQHLQTEVFEDLEISEIGHSYSNPTPFSLCWSICRTLCRDDINKIREGLAGTAKTHPNRLSFIQSLGPHSITARTSYYS